MRCKLLREVEGKEKNKETDSSAICLHACQPTSNRIAVYDDDAEFLRQQACIELPNSNHRHQSLTVTGLPPKPSSSALLAKSVRFEAARAAIYPELSKVASWLYSPERRIVSRTRMACSSPSGRVCAGPVHTRACASSTVALGRGSPAGRYESDTDGFQRPPSSSTSTPASSIHDGAADAATASPRRHLRPPPTSAAEPTRTGAGGGETRRLALRIGVGPGSAGLRREFIAREPTSKPWRERETVGRRRPLQQPSDGTGRKNRGGLDRAGPTAHREE